jgi:hypothetical protein
MLSSSINLSLLGKGDPEALLLTKYPPFGGEADANAASADAATDLCSFALLSNASTSCRYFFIR